MVGFGMILSPGDARTLTNSFRAMVELPDVNLGKSNRSERTQCQGKSFFKARA